MNGGQFLYTFAYNAEGIRTVKTNGNTIHHYTLNGSQIVTETWVTKTQDGEEIVEHPNHFLVYLYDESGAPIGLQYRNKTYEKYDFDTYYFEKNLQGDIIAIYTEAGTKIGSYTYDAWGNCTVSTESGTTTIQKQIVRTLNPFRYRGYYYDTDTGLYYLQSRYYVPQWGRFLNADGYVSTGTGLLGYNMYAYCGNNPIMNVDPDGHAWLHWALAAMVVVVCAAATVATCGMSLSGAAFAIGMVASGSVAFTTASTVAAAATIGSAMVLGAIITSSTKQRLETLEVTKRELEDKILIENMKRPLRTEDELWAWFRYMRNFDLTRLEERRHLIDVFVNTVFLYNDRFLLTLNFGYGSKTVLFTDIPCSDKVACGRPFWL